MFIHMLKLILIHRLIFLHKSLKLERFHLLIASTKMKKEKFLGVNKRKGTYGLYLLLNALFLQKKLKENGCLANSKDHKEFKRMKMKKTLLRDR